MLSLLISLLVAAGSSGLTGESFFNVWAAFLYVWYFVGAVFTVFYSPEPIHWGVMAGSTFFLSQLALMIAALSGAHLIGNVTAVTGIASVVFIIGTPFSVLAYLWRDEFTIGGQGTYLPVSQKRSSFVDKPLEPSSSNPSGTYHTTA